MYCKVSPDTVHVPVLHDTLGGGLMVILYPIIFDLPLSDGSVHCIVALLYVVDCTDTVSGALGGSSTLYFSYEHKLFLTCNISNCKHRP